MLRYAAGVVAAIILAASADAASAQAGSSQQVPPQLYQLDDSLKRNPCADRSKTALPAEIVLDGSGRYVDLIATPARPAYWGPDVPVLTVRNVPTPPHEGALSDDLVLEAQKAEAKLSWPIEAGGEVKLERGMLDASVANGGLLLLRVKRHGVLVSTLSLILRESNVILLGADGPIDPIYRSTTVAAHMPCDFRLEYVRDFENLLVGPPVVVAPALKMSTPPSSAPPATPAVQTLDPIQVPASGQVEVKWADLNYLKRGRDQDVQLVVLKNGRAVSVLWITGKATSGFRPIISADKLPAQVPVRTGSPTPAPDAAPRKIEVSLDRLGVASPAFLNRRRPAYIPAEAANLELVFTSSASDRAYVVTFSGIPEAERAELVRSGAQIGACRDARCKAAIRVPPGGSAALAISALRNAYARNATGSTVTFDVAFYDDDTTPVNSRGYITFFDEPLFVEPGSSTTWSGALTVNLLNDPDLTGSVPKDQKTLAITPANPLARTNRTHVSGSATAGLRQNMGSRADFDVELTAKSGDFGQDSSLKASKYLANIYSSFGATLTGGRLDVAAPTDAIAFAESGDAVNAGGRLGPGFGGIGYVFRKEASADGFTVKKVQDAIDAGAVQLDRNNRDLVLQWRDLNKGRVRVGMYGVVGDADRGRLRDTADPDPTDDEKPAKTLVEFDANAWSVGGETVVNLGHAYVSFGLYHSERSNNAPEDLKVAGDDTSGNVGLLSLRYTNIDHDRFEGNQLAADFSITGQVGHGGKYVGENQSFVPDSLFLAKFSGLLKDSSGAIGPGLTNKWYYGLLVTTPKIAPGRGVATLELHHYRLNEERAGSRTLGTEASIEFRLEQPKGIRYQLAFAGFKPGAALNTSDPAQALMTKFQYAIKFGVTIRME